MMNSWKIIVVMSRSICASYNPLIRVGPPLFTISGYVKSHDRAGTANATTAAAKIGQITMIQNLFLELQIGFMGKGFFLTRAGRCGKKCMYSDCLGPKSGFRFHHNLYI